MSVAILLVMLCVASSFAISVEEMEKPVSSPVLPYQDASEYWTPERMAAAIPMDIVRKGEPNVTDIPSMENHGTPIFSSPQPPTKFAEEVNATAPLYPFPFSSAFAPNYNTWPWFSVGKVFFTQGGVNYVCSGATVNQFIIYTAGHCVYSLASGWSYNFAFVPGYNNGNRPYGTFSSYQLWTTGGWYNSESFCYDVGISVMNRINGYGVGDVVGWFGALWNGAYALSWRSLGYPQAAPFNGQWDYYADSSLGTIDTFCSPNTIGIGSDTTGGASGGPWVYGWGSSYYINSVNSYKYNTQPLAIYGPYFGTAAHNIYTAAIAVIP